MLRLWFPAGRFVNSRAVKGTQLNFLVRKTVKILNKSASLQIYFLKLQWKSGVVRQTSEASKVSRLAYQIFMYFSCEGD